MDYAASEQEIRRMGDLQVAGPGDPEPPRAAAILRAATQSIESPEIGLKSSDLFYLTHMDQREALTDTRQLDELLKSQQPALLLISNFGAWGQHPIHGRISDRLSLSQKSYDVITTGRIKLEQPELFGGAKSQTPVRRSPGR